MKKAFDISHLKEERKYWRTVEESCMDDKIKKIYYQRKKAVDMYIDGFTAKQIADITGIKGNSEPKRLLCRCLTSDEYGVSIGYTGLIPFKHVFDHNIRKTKESLFTSENGQACMFQYLITSYPELKEYINSLYFGKNNAVLEKNMSIKTLHQFFIKKCRELGIKEYEYPFNTQSKGLRALYTYTKSLKVQCPEMNKARLSKDAYQKLTSTGIGDMVLLPDVRPFSVVQIDGHKIDCIVTIDIITPKGDIETKTIERFWLLTLIDVATRAILGYHITVKSAYNRFDVLKCVENAVQPKQLINFTIPGLEYPPNSGFHSITLPEAEWAVFDELMLDNALAHLSKDVINHITTYLNTTLNFGPVASPERRGIIERFYQTLESHGYHRIVSTTGTGINDTRRRNAEKDAIKYKVRFEHLKELTEVLIAQYNNDSHGANNGFTPLEVMEQRMTRGLLPNYLEKEKREKFMLNYFTVSRKIRGKLGTGRRPYVSFEGAEYRSEILSKSFELVGRNLILKFNPDDIRICKAFFEDGSEFCDLCVVGQWRYKPHSLDQRRAANKLLNEKKLRENTFIDPMKTYDDFLLNESQTSKRARNKLAARQLTQQSEENQMNDSFVKKDKSDEDRSVKNGKKNILSEGEIEARFKNKENMITFK